MQADSQKGNLADPVPLLTIWRRLLLIAGAALLPWVCWVGLMIGWHNGEVCTLWLAAGKISGRPVAIWPANGRSDCKTLTPGLAELFAAALRCPRKISATGFGLSWNFTLLVRVRGQGSVELPIKLHVGPEPHRGINQWDHAYRRVPYITFLGRSTNPLHAHLSAIYESTPVKIGRLTASQENFLRMLSNSAPDPSTHGAMR